MKSIKYDANLMKIMSLFEQITHTPLKDCFEDDSGKLLFVVEQHLLRKAVGKNAVYVKKIEKLLNRKIKIVGFTPNLSQFIKNLTYPLQIKDIQEKDGVITIKGENTQTRGILIGKNGQNLQNNTSIVKRYFDIKEIKVI